MQSDMIDRPVGRREARKQDRRETIVAAARRSFLDDGYAATSMSGLLKSLGGSKETLWSYFRSKEELFAAVIEDVTVSLRQQLVNELVTTGEPGPTLVAFCRSFIDRISNPDAIATWRLVLAESGRFPEVGRIFHARAAGHVEAALATYIARQIEAGRLRNEDPVRMAQMLIGLCSSRQNKMLWGVATENGSGSDEDAVRFSDYFLRLFAVD